MRTLTTFVPTLAIGVGDVTAEQNGIIAKAGVDALPQVVGR